uniref:Putative inosine-uridine preferring nucleoside hydrolase n=1 Tax=Nyssomyia neivai TaxID=330878 RepID=A0A1L8DYD6_9DIPT
MTSIIDSEVQRKIIVDVDVGTDDAWSLLLLLRAQEYTNVNVLGITCVKGNTAVGNVAENTLKVLSAFESVKCGKPPIFVGASSELIALRERSPDDYSFHGKDGFCDLECYSEEPNDPNLISKEHAVNAIERLVMENPGQVIIICLGPLTNLGLCLRMYPHVAEKIKDVYIMGGNYLGVGNYTSAAEFNFFNDPESVHIVLHTLKCPMFLLPWEACLEDKFHISMDWRMNVLGDISNRITKLLNPIEQKCYRDFQDWMPCDTILTAVVLAGKSMIEKSTTWNATVELSGHHTRGQFILDHLRKKPDNLTIIEKVNQETFKDIMLWTAGHENVDTKKFLP